MKNCVSIFLCWKNFVRDVVIKVTCLLNSPVYKYLGWWWGEGGGDEDAAAEAGPGEEASQREDGEGESGVRYS